MDDEVFNNHNASQAQQCLDYFIDHTASSIMTPMFISVETQTISQNTIDVSTQTCTAISSVIIEDVITDEDIIKHLTKKNKKSNIEQLIQF